MSVGNPGPRAAGSRRRRFDRALLRLAGALSRRRLAAVDADLRRRASIHASAVLSAFARIQNETARPEAVTIGLHSWLWGEVVVARTGCVRIGEWSIVREDTRLISATSITIGNYVGVARLVDIIDGHDNAAERIETVRRRDPRLAAALRMAVRPGPIVIEDDVWIGSKVTILGGVRIGRGAIVANGSLVLDDVPPGAIVVGAPARVVKYRAVPDAGDEPVQHVVDLI